MKRVPLNSQTRILMERVLPLRRVPPLEQSESPWVIQNSKSLLLNKGLG